MLLKDLNKKSFFIMILEFILVTFGCFLLALSFSLFFAPNNIAPGGFSGIATVIFIKTGFPIGISTFLLCSPLFVFTFKDLGKQAFLKALYGTFMFSFFVDLCLNYFSVFTNDMILASIFGGALAGLGLGIILKFKGSTGGTDLLSLILNKYFPFISIGNWLLIVDFLVVSIAGIVLKNIEVSMYSVISIFICMKVIDLIQNGLTYEKAFYIFTEHPKEIKNAIFELLDRGVTIFKAKGGYKDEDREVVFCVVSRSQVAFLKDIIRELDKNAFIVLADVHEVLGEGFNQHNI